MSTSGLSTPRKDYAKSLAMRAAWLGLHHAPNIHYTEDSRRWEGIASKKLAIIDQYPSETDCSAFYTWCIWNGLRGFKVRDVVNDRGWRSGYTGTMVNNGKSVDTPIHADACLYGDPYGSTGHVAIYVGGGKVVSMGSEAGPFHLDVHYRSDFIGYRRYI